jgi:hypothetical protein
LRSPNLQPFEGFAIARIWRLGEFLQFGFASRLYYYRYRCKLTSIDADPELAASIRRRRSFRYVALHLSRHSPHQIIRRNTDCVDFVHSSVPRELFGEDVVNSCSQQTHSKKEAGMQIVLIDSFVVRDGSKKTFLQRVRRSGDILKTLAGFSRARYTRKRAVTQIQM